MGLTMAPATDSVMGSLPLGKAGVGSAVNDTTRQVGGALGVAIIGSVLASTYGSKVGDFLAGTGAPEAAIEGAKSSLGGAQMVAERAATPEQGQALMSVANQAFVDALHWGVLVAAVATGLGAVMAFVFLPAHARADNLSAQDGEFLTEHAHDVDVAAIRDEVP
jgi:hypothetical protein